MIRLMRSFIFPMLLLTTLMSCGRYSESTLSEDTYPSKRTEVSARDINNVTSTEVLNLIRTTGDTYRDENFKSMRHCANCLSQRRIGQIAESMLKQQINFLKGVFVDGAYGDFKLVVYDAPNLLYKSARGVYNLWQRMDRFAKSYGSMVSEYYTGEDYLGYGSQNARNTIDKSVQTMMSMTQFLQEKGYAAAETLAKTLYDLYRNPDKLKAHIYNMVRLLSSALTTGHGFVRSISCATVVSLFDEWIPRITGMVAYEVLIEVVLGLVTVGTAGAGAALMAGRVGMIIAKLGKMASKIRYMDEIIAGMKKMAAMVVSLVKRGEDAGPVARNADEGGTVAQGFRKNDDLTLPRVCRVGFNLAGGDCKADELAEKIKDLKPEYRVPIVYEYIDKIAKKWKLKKDNRITRMNNRRVYVKGKGKKTTYYAVDTQHGHFEICSRNGKHRGSIDIDGNEVVGKLDESGKHDLIVE